MRSITIIFNILLLGLLGYLLAEDGLPQKPFEIFIVSVFILTPLCNLLYLQKHTCITGKPEGIVSLYFKRKRLEEKKRIAELEQK